MLDPNRAVEAVYFDYLIETDDGQQRTGMIERESGSGISLLGPDGRRHLIPRARIEHLQSLGRSMMPEGLEQRITPQEMADLLARLLGRK